MTKEFLDAAVAELRKIYPLLPYDSLKKMAQIMRDLIPIYYNNKENK